MGEFLDNKINLVYLHGFLGSPMDFRLIEKKAIAAGIQLQSWGPNYFIEGPCSAAHDYATWTDHFFQELDSRFGQTQKVVLMGYSLGGRLALCAYFRQPARFSRLILLSVNPGLFSSTEDERRAWENHWGRLFRERPWAEAMAEWNAQEVFNQTTPLMVPQEGQMQRELVADSVSRWSLLNHPYQIRDLYRLPSHTEWWFGQEDHKFMKVKEELERLKVPGEYQVVSHAGHRLCLDCPELLAHNLKKMGDL